MDTPGERPDGGGWVAAAVGVVGFLAGGGLCLATCFGLLYLYSLTLPRQTEVSDALAEIPAFVCGLGLTVVLSLSAGVASGAWAARRVGR